MSEILLLCGLMSAALFVAFVVAVLAVGALYGVLWLLWKCCLFMAETVECWVNREPPAGKANEDATVTVYTRVSRAGVRGHGGRRVVRVPQGLVPAAPVAAQRDLERVQRGGRCRPRGRDDRGR